MICKTKYLTKKVNLSNEIKRSIVKSYFNVFIKVKLGNVSR